MPTVSTGVVVVYEQRTDTLNKHPIWERVTTFSLISGDTTGLATIEITGLLQKIVVKLSDMESAECTTDVSLTDNGDNTIWSVTNLAESATYNYSVSEPLSQEVNVILGFTNPAAAATVTVTLRGI